MRIAIAYGSAAKISPSTVIASKATAAKKYLIAFMTSMLGQQGLSVHDAYLLGEGWR